MHSLAGCTPNIFNTDCTEPQGCSKIQEANHLTPDFTPLKSRSLPTHFSNYSRALSASQAMCTSEQCRRPYHLWRHQLHFASHWRSSSRYISRAPVKLHKKKTFYKLIALSMGLQDCLLLEHCNRTSRRVASAGSSECFIRTNVIIEPNCPA